MTNSKSKASCDINNSDSNVISFPHPPQNIQRGGSNNMCRNMGSVHTSPNPYLINDSNNLQFMPNLQCVFPNQNGQPTMFIENKNLQIKEKIVEIPNLQIMEKVVEVPQIVRREKIVRIPKIEMVERIIPTAKTQVVEKIVEVIQYQYKEVPVEKIVTVPEVQVQVVLKEVDVPVNVDIPIPQPRQLPFQQCIQRNIPVPVNITTTQNYKIPQLKPKYVEVPVPIYVPRYIEVPIPVQFCPVDNSSKFPKTNLNRTSSSVTCSNNNTGSNMMMMNNSNCAVNNNMFNQRFMMQRNSINNSNLCNKNLIHQGNTNNHSIPPIVSQTGPQNGVLNSTVSRGASSNRSENNEAIFSQQKVYKLNGHFENENAAFIRRPSSQPSPVPLQTSSRQVSAARLPVLVS